MSRPSELETDCGHTQVRNGILEPRILKSRSLRCGSDIEIEVACRKNYDIKTISAGIIQQLAELAEPELIAVAALKMQVVDTSAGFFSKKSWWANSAPGRTNRLLLWTATVLSVIIAVALLASWLYK